MRVLCVGAGEICVVYISGASSSSSFVARGVECESRGGKTSRARAGVVDEKAILFQLKHNGQRKEKKRKTQSTESKTTLLVVNTDPESASLVC